MPQLLLLLLLDICRVPAVHLVLIISSNKLLIFNSGLTAFPLVKICLFASSGTLFSKGNYAIYFCFLPPGLLVPVIFLSTPTSTSLDHTSLRSRSNLRCLDHKNLRPSPNSRFSDHTNLRPTPPFRCLDHRNLRQRLRLSSLDHSDLSWGDQVDYFLSSTKAH